MLVARPFNPEQCQIITPVQAADSAELAYVRAQSPSWGDWIEWRVDALSCVQALCGDLTDDKIGSICEKARMEAVPVSAPLPESLRCELEKCAEIFLQIGLPVLATIRTRPEGGACSLCDEHYAALIDFLCTLEPVCACDVEFLRENSHCVRSEVRSRGRQVISSQHFFDLSAADELSPAALLALLALLQRDADVAKIALACDNGARCEQIVQAGCQYAHRNEVPADAFILIAMGIHGQPTRVRAGEMGCCATFAALHVAGEALASAPGQIDVETMRAALR